MQRTRQVNENLEDNPDTPGKLAKPLVELSARKFCVPANAPFAVGASLPLPRSVADGKW